MTRLLKIISLSLALVSLCFQAVAQDVSVQESRKARLEKEISSIDRQLTYVQKESNDAMARYNLVRKKVDTRKALVDESQKVINGYSEKIRSAQKEIDRMQTRIDTLTVYYGKLVKSAYKSRDVKSWYMYFLASDNIAQAFRRFNYFKSLSSNLSSQAQKIKDAQAELESQKEQLAKLKNDAEAIKMQRQADLDKIRAEEKEEEQIIAELKRNKNKYTKQIAEKRRQIDALDREIRNIINKANGKKSEPVDYKLAAEFEKNKGILPWPVEGAVVESYGQHYHPVFTTVKLPFNKGIEIAVSPDCPVKTVFNGVVSHVVVLPSYNICVLVQHGNYFSFYCKLKNADVKVGDKVSTGQKIGTADTIRGESRLHFEIWKGQDHQNPEIWLRP